MNRTWQRGVLAGLALILVLTIVGTWWLLERGTRGAEIANVLTLPVAMAGLLLAVRSLLAPASADEPAGTGTPHDRPDRWATGTASQPPA